MFTLIASTIDSKINKAAEHHIKFIKTSEYFSKSLKNLFKVKGISYNKSMRKQYPSDITHEQFEHIRPVLESGRKKTAPRKVDLYEVFCAVLYLLKSGCQWRMLPEVFPKWTTVYYYFSIWNKPQAENVSRLHQCLKKELARLVIEFQKCFVFFAFNLSSSRAICFLRSAYLLFITDFASSAAMDDKDSLIMLSAVRMCCATSTAISAKDF